MCIMMLVYSPLIVVGSQGFFFINRLFSVHFKYRQVETIMICCVVTSSFTSESQLCNSCDKKYHVKLIYNKFVWHIYNYNLFFYFIKLIPGALPAVSIIARPISVSTGCCSMGRLERMGWE